jgi:hypothetical protein
MDDVSQAGPLHAAPVSIADACSQCFTGLEDLIRRLHAQISLDIDEREGLDMMALELYGRMGTWSEESRAALPAASRGSLDDTLRDDKELHGVVVDILLKIHRQIEFGI